MSPRIFASFLIGVLLAPLFALVAPTVQAQTSELDKLQQGITDSGNRLAEIEKEIAKFEKELKTVGSERQTLQKALNQLSLERKKVQAEISKTENIISSTDLEINKLVLEINKTERIISEIQAGIAEIIRSEYKASETSLVEQLLTHKQLSDFWSTFEAHETVRESMSTKVAELDSLQKLLNEKRETNSTKRSELLSLHTQYKDQNSALASNQAEQADLLAVTKSEEKNYQKLLAQKQEAKDQIIKDLRNYESQIKFYLDPSTVPTAGSGVFDWPLKNIVITQNFGGTEFAKRNPGIYAGRAYHPGLDLGTPRGTAIYAPLTGTVRATGNTDLVPGCYSWGKWTLIDHANGLSTLYAHQDVISVVAGQKVTTGEIIGYSGNTGYSTGPHLHFTVYAKDAVTVRKFNEIKTVTSCGPASTPISAVDGYLDPILYLKPL